MDGIELQPHNSEPQIRLKHRSRGLFVIFMMLEWECHSGLSGGGGEEGRKWDGIHN